MNKTKRVFAIGYGTSVALVVFALAFVTVYAQQERNVGGSLVADQDRYQTQDQDQDRTNQPEGAGSSTVPAAGAAMEQAQVMNQNRDQVQAPATGQQAGQGQEGSDESLQVQNREQIRMQTPSELRQYIQERTQSQVRQSEDGTDEPEQLRNRAMAAVQAVQAAENLLGQNGPRMSEIAEQVNQAAQGMEQREEALQQRSWLRAFFFGQDQEQAQALKNETEQNRLRVQEMNQLLVECGECDAEVKTMLQEQMQTMLQEQDRLDQVAEKAIGRWGLLGWLFGN